MRRWAVLGGTPQYQLWAGTGALSTSSRSGSWPRTRRSTRMRGTCCATARECAIPARTSRSCARSPVARRGTTRSRSRPACRPATSRASSSAWRISATSSRAQPLAPSGFESRASYQLSDPYFRFWFRYVASNRSRLEQGRVEEVLEEILADFDNVMGWAFEECCRRWVAAYASDDATGAPQEIGAFWSRDGRTEVDVVGVRKHRYVHRGLMQVAQDGGDRRARRAARATGSARTEGGARSAGDLRARGIHRRAAGGSGEEDVLLVTAADLFA